MRKERCVLSSLGLILRQPARTVQACESGHILRGVRKSSPKQKCSNPFGETILEFSYNFLPKNFQVFEKNSQGQAAPVPNT